MEIKDIEKRLESEEAFHDRKFAAEHKQNYYSWGFTNIVFRNMIDKLGDIRDKRVLEFGCGSGWITRILAEKGAEVWTFDISKEATRMTDAYLRRHNLRERVHIDQMAAEKLTYEDDTFDFVIGSAILHHVDLNVCAAEIKRVLKVNGKAIFMEPLGHNPLLNLYRKMTPDLRSKDETPLRFEQFDIFRKYFSGFEHEEYYLTALIGLGWYFLGMKSLMITTRDLFHKFDKAILALIPGLRKYCWYSILTMTK